MIWNFNTSLQIFSEGYSAISGDTYSSVEAPKGELLFILYQMKLINLIDVVLNLLDFYITRFKFNV